MVAGALGGLVLGYREYINKPVIDKRVLDQVDNGYNCLTISQGYYPKPNPVSNEYMRMSADGSLGIGQSNTEPMEFGENFDISKIRIVNSNVVNYDQDYSVMSQVSFKPGPDGNLYIKINDEWKQVLTS